MKKVIAALLLSICISSVALAGDIPGSLPCTENCPATQFQPEADEFSIIEIVTGILALIF